MVDALAAGDAAGVYGTIDRVVEAGHDPRRFSVDLLDRFRDLILLDAVPDAAERGLIDVPQDQLTHMTDQALRLGAATLTRCAEIVHTALIEMRGTTAPRLVLELLCARMMLPDASVDAAAVLQRVERLERRLTAAPEPPAAPPVQSQSAPKSARTGGEAEPAPAPAPAAPPAPAEPTPSSPPVQSESAPKTARTGGEAVAPAPAAAPEVDGVDMRRLWPQVLDVISRSSKTIWAMLDGSQVTESGEGTVTLSVAPSLAKRLADERNVTVIAAAITSLIGGAWRVDVQPGAGRNGPAATGKAEPDVDPRDDTDYEAPSANGESTPPADPEADALRLLRDELGARPLES